MTPTEIVKQVAKEHKIPLLVLLDNKNRTPTVTCARREATRRLRKAHWSYGKIAEALGITKGRVYKLNQ